MMLQEEQVRLDPLLALHAGMDGPQAVGKPLKHRREARGTLCSARARGWGGFSVTQKPVCLGRGCMRKKWVLRDATTW